MGKKKTKNSKKKRPSNIVMARRADTKVCVRVRGIDLCLDADTFNDFEFIDALDQVESGLNPLRAAYVMRTITGEKFNEVMALLRDPETKRVPSEAAAEFVNEFMQEAAKAAPKS